MGVASVMVVLLHFFVELYPAFHIPGVTAVLGRGNVGVDIFLLVSGMGLWFSMSKNTDMKCFYRKRIHKVLLPTLAITLPYWIWFDLFYKKIGILRLILDWTGLSFWTHGVTTIWYVSLILLCYLCYPLVFQMQKKNRNLVIGLATTLIVLLCLFAAVMPQAYERYEIALTRLPVFLIGSYLGEYLLNKQTPESSKHVLNLYIMVTVIMFAASAVVNDRNHMLGVMLYRYGSGGVGILICFVVCWVLEKWTLKFISKFLKYLGTVSLQLYLIHVMIRNAVHESPLGAWIGTPQRLVVIVVFILVSLLLTCLVCRLKGRFEKRHTNSVVT